LNNRNLKYMRKFAECYPDFEFMQEALAQKNAFPRAISTLPVIWHSLKTIKNLVIKR
jgi:hypothetical protein